jgi:hypothetical protein
MMQKLRMCDWTGMEPPIVPKPRTMATESRSTGDGPLSPR